MSDHSIDNGSAIRLQESRYRNNKPVSFVISGPMREAAKYVAALEGQNISDLMRKALLYYCEHEYGDGFNQIYEDAKRRYAESLIS